MALLCRRGVRAMEPEQLIFPSLPSGGMPRMRSCAAAVRALRRFNRRWELRLEVFRRYAFTPLWAEGVVIDAPVRQAHERYLSVDLFCDELYTVAQYVLPAVSWVPGVLCGPRRRQVRGPRNSTPLSLPDLWAKMPYACAGRLTFRLEEVFPLLCALADPARHGTRAGRYPDQLAGVHGWLASRQLRPVHALDIGCGVGHGTFELAGALNESRCAGGACVGVTAEPLEVWMATHRQLPHDPRRMAELRTLALTAEAAFVTGTATNVPCDGPFDVIVCNGLVGGDFLGSDKSFRGVLSEFRRLLAAGGRVSLANRFHEGARGKLQRFAELARGDGWRVEGEPRLLWLSRQSASSRTDDRHGLGRLLGH